jgi:aspartate/methionine/tyrosine aminotransferase
LKKLLIQKTKYESRPWSGFFIYMPMITTAQRLHQVDEYYFSTKLREVRQLAAQGKPIINMGIGSPDLAPHPSVIQAVQMAMTEPSAHQYQSYQGLPELRIAMTAFYQKHFSVTLNPETEVLPLMGSKEGIMHISMAFLNPGDQVLIPNPGYPTYASVTKLVGAEPVLYDLLPERDWQPDFEALEQLDSSKIKLIWISYPHMPTGTKADIDLLARWVALAQKHNALLVNDNPYSFVLNSKPTSLLQVPEANGICLELNSLSKTFNMAGWRVGMVLGNPDLIQAVLQVKSNFDSGMFYGVQKGAVAALQLDDSWFKKQDEIYQKRRALIFKIVQKLKCTACEDSAGLFVWAKLPDGILDAEKFVDEILYSKHIFVAPGTVFGSNGQGYIRFSLCVDENKITEALSRF